MNEMGWVGSMRFVTTVVRALMGEADFAGGETGYCENTRTGRCRRRALGSALGCAAAAAHTIKLIIVTTVG